MIQWIKNLIAKKREKEEPSLVELMREMKKELKWRPVTPADIELDIPGDDMYTLSEFNDLCNTNSFIDYDGFGHFATANEVSNIPICPSEMVTGSVKTPDWATHVCWFNR